MADNHVPEPRNFEPKQKVDLAPPKSDPITLEQLSKCDGSDPSKPTLVAIKGKVYDVTGNSAYAKGGQYHLFAGKDASRALASTSLKAQDVRPEWQDLSEKEKGVLADWVTFFGKRYNVVGIVQGASNL
ncbi:MAG: hypothetical protein M1825_003018 [Sarcosagium campestre]|nr:MAG: hypothetical protein M1825_003018 [Sarcosagium campestre]